MNEERIEVVDGNVTLETLAGAIRETATHASWYVERQERNLDVFFTWWDGQSEDGRKHKEDLQKEPFPWEGASDTRVRLAEDVTADNCRLMQAALRGAQANLMPVEPGDETRAAVGTKVLRWLMRNAMAADVRLEAKLARHWRERHGASVTRVTWIEETRLEKKEFAAPMVVAELAAQVAQAGAAPGMDPAQIEVMAQNEAMDLLFNVGREKELKAALKALQPLVAAKAWRKAIAAWRTGETAMVPVPYVHHQRPCWTALRVMEDVFFPVETGDLQKAPWVAVREWLGEADVRSRAETEEWTDGFAEELVKHKGASCLGDSGGMLAGKRWSAGHSQERLEPETQELYELWTFYRKAVDEANVPGVYVTVFSPMVKEMAARENELLDYAHGEYPFHVHRREVYERPVLESRGVPEIVMTWQSEVKAQRDARTDRADMETLPPAEAPTGTSRQRLDFGPGAINYTRTAGSFRFMQITGTGTTSLEVEKRTMEEVNWFFGRIAENVPAARRQLCLQELVEDYFEEMAAVMRQTWQLAEQFLPPELVARVCGDEGAGRMWAATTREEMRRQFDVKLRFDARDLDPELLTMKMKVVNEAVIPADVAGVLDRAKYTRWQMYAIDASMAEEMVQAIDSVSQKEIEDEQVQLTKISGGIEPPMKENGQNAQLRLQVIQNAIQSNPQLQQRYAQDEIYKKLVDARVQHFQFQLQQRENAQIGRIGAGQVLGKGQG